MEVNYVVVALEPVKDSDLDQLIKFIKSKPFWTSPVSGARSRNRHRVTLVHPFLKPRPSSDLTLKKRASSSGEITANTPRWLSLDHAEERDWKREIVKLFASLLVEENDESKGLASHAMAELVHGVGDSICASGSCLELVVLTGENAPTIEAHLPLYGSLKRLEECYHARVSLVYGPATPLESVAPPLEPAAPPPGLSLLRTCLRARLVPAGRDWAESDACWRGKLVLHDQKTRIEMPSFVLRVPDEDAEKKRGDEEWQALLRDCGLEARPPQTPETDQAGDEKVYYVSGRLELSETDVTVSSVPPCVFTGTKLTLSLDENRVPRQESESLLEYLKSNPQLCCVGRLVVSEAEDEGESRTLSPTPLRCPKTHKLASDIWKERVENPPSLPVEDLPQPGRKTCYVFVIRHVGDACHAYLLHQPSAYSARHVPDSVRPALQPADVTRCQRDVTDDVKETRAALDDVPALSERTLRWLEEEVTRLQKLVVAEWLKRKRASHAGAVLSAAEVETILAGVRDGYYKVVLAALPRTRLKHGPQEAATDKYSAVPEPCRWPERAALVEQEVRAQFLRLDRCSLPPKTKDKPEPTLSLDAAEFVKMFLPSGESAEQDLSPVTIQEKKLHLVKRFARTNVGEAVTGDYSQLIDCSYHDVYYNRGRSDDLKNEALTRLRDRQQADRLETACTLDKNAPPVTFAMLAAQRSRAKKKIEEGMNTKAEAGRRVSVCADERVLRPSDTNSANQKPQKGHVTALPNHMRSMRRTVSASGLEMRSSTLRGRETRKSSEIESTEQSKNENPMEAENAPRSKYKKPALTPSENKARQQKNHQKLCDIVELVLGQHGVKKDHDKFQSCFDKLRDLTKCELKGLKTSRNLEEEIRKVATLQTPLVLYRMGINAQVTVGT